MIWISSNKVLVGAKIPTIFTLGSPKKLVKLSPTLEINLSFFIIWASLDPIIISAALVNVAVPSWIRNPETMELLPKNIFGTPPGVKPILLGVLRIKSLISVSTQGCSAD